MSKIVVISIALTLAISSLGARAEPPSARLATTFGNTILSIYPDGRSQKIWMQPDGSWTGRSRRGRPLAGTWKIKGEKVCLRQTSPPTLPISFCQVLPSDPAVGVDAKDVVGTSIHLELVKGHVVRPPG